MQIRYGSFSLTPTNMDYLTSVATQKGHWGEAWFLFLEALLPEVPGRPGLPGSPIPGSPLSPFCPR